MPFLSIVIPVYNGEKIIDRCLNSIWSQNLDIDEYEVICVDDCSKDGTLEHLNSIANKHTNLRVLHNKTNLCAGGARNYGVKEAKGEYIVFIDSDDYFHNGSLRKVIDYQKDRKLDILVCDFVRHQEGDYNEYLVHNFSNKVILTGRKFMLVNGLPYAPWKYIFKRNLMLDNSIFFEECVSCEDVDWSHKLALYAKTMQYIPILLTHYILMPDSQTGSEFKNKNRVFNRLYCGLRILRLLELCKTEDEKNHILNVAISTYQNGILFLNALFISPFLKSSKIKEYIPIGNNYGRIINLVRNMPLLYSIFSTLISPLFLLLVKLKRKFRGR